MQGERTWTNPVSPQSAREELPTRRALDFSPREAAPGTAEAPSAAPGAKHAVASMGPVLQKVIESKFVLPKTPVAEINESYQKLADEIDTAFASLSDM